MSNLPPPGNRPAAWLLIPAALAAAFLLIPLLALLTRANWGGLLPLLVKSENLAALWLSLQTTLSATAIVLLIGTPAAVWVGNLRGNLARITHLSLVIPMTLPPVVAGLALLATWGRYGLLGQKLQVLGIEIGFTSLAVILAQVFVSLPFFITTLADSLTAKGRDFETTARELGASPSRIFFTITLPVNAPALASATALAFARALGEFGATITFAGSLQAVTRTMPLQIYLTRESAPDSAISLALALIGLALASFALAGFFGSHFFARIIFTLRTSIAGRLPLRTQERETAAWLPADTKETGARIEVQAEVTTRGIIYENLIFPAGSSTSVMGVNGAGKSTLLDLINGNLPAEKGQISVVPPGAKIVTLRQKPLLFAHLSVVENVAYPLRCAAVARGIANRQALAALAEVNMETYADKPATALSGGQAARVAFARALILRPQIVLLDEPLAALDVEGAELLRGILRKKLAIDNPKASRPTTIFVTHDAADARELSERTILLRAGRVHEITEP